MSKSLCSYLGFKFGSREVKILVILYICTQVTMVPLPSSSIHGA